MGLLKRIGLPKPATLLRDPLLMADRMAPAPGVPVLGYHKIAEGEGVERHPLAVSRERFDVAEEASSLIVSELVSNALRHVGGPVGFRLGRMGACLFIGVGDGDPRAMPVLRHAHPEQIGGRGLLIVEAVAEDWGVEASRTGKLVWATVATNEPWPFTNGR